MPKLLRTSIVVPRYSANCDIMSKQKSINMMFSLLQNFHMYLWNL